MGKKGQKVQQTRSMVEARRKQAFARFIQGESQSKIAKDYGLTSQTISHDINLILSEIQEKMRDDLNELIAESFASYREVRYWAMNIMHDDAVEMRERLTAANTLLRAQTRIDKLTGAEQPEKMLVQNKVPEIELIVSYPQNMVEVQEAEVIEEEDKPGDDELRPEGGE